MDAISSFMIVIIVNPSVSSRNFEVGIKRPVGNSDANSYIVRYIKGYTGI